ncbi:girdin-like [Pseudoliparis swirei]|uniref:girdin-like n=1 Tax=Pseudoliparis swirei TaxID=2059687 RepID=UPI0024BE1D89|nr:girdin-like [Pseudoliparis swirei]
MEDMHQQTTITGEMQLPEAFAQNCIIRDDKVNISEDAQKIQAWRSEPLEKDLCGAKASVRALTELMDKNKTTLDQTLKIGQEEKVGNIGTVVTEEELAEVIQAWRTKPLRKDLCRAKASVRALTEMDNNGIKMDNTLNIEEKFENIRINLINTAGSVYQEDHLIGEMQLPEAFAQNCIIHDQKVNISEDAQKIQAWRSETLEKDLCGAKASVTVLTELMENNKITFDKILNLERLEINRLTVENEKLRKTPALKNTSDQETLNIYHQKTEKLKKDLWKWKQRVTAVNDEKTSLQSELHTAQVNIKDLLETNASLKETVNRMPLDLKAPDNTQVVLEEENTALKTQLKEAKVKHRKYARTIAYMTEDSSVQLREVQAAAQDLEKERNNLRQDLHAAQVNIKEHLETIASLKETVNRMPLGLKATDNTQVVLEEKNTFLKTELHTAKDNIQDQLETIASFNSALTRVPLGRKAPANTQVVLEEENTFLKTELKEAKLQHRRYAKIITDMTQQSTDWILEVQDATKDLENERITLRRDLHAAQVNIKDLLATNASLDVAVNRVPLDQKAPDNTQVVLEEKNTFLKTELHTAQLKIKDLLETNTSLNVAVNWMALDVKAPDNTQVVLEQNNTFLKSELHTAQLKIKDQQDEANALAESLCRWKQRVTGVTQEKTSLQTALHTAQHKIKDQLALEKQKTSLQSELHTAQLKIKEQQHEANSLAESLCSWKQIVTGVTQENTSLERELHTAQHQLKAQLALEEQNTSLQSELHTAQHQLKAQLALEEQNTSLQSELHTAQHQLKAQLALEEQNTSLQSELHTAQLKIKEQLESLAALNEKVQQHPLNQEAAKDQETLKIYQQKTEKLKKDLWKWKQRVASLQGELHTAQVTIKDLMETNASLNVAVNRVPLDQKAPDNTQLVLEQENIALKTELKEAKVKYARTIAYMTEDSSVQLREVQAAAQDLEKERNNLRQDLHGAQVNNKELLETIAALSEMVKQHPLNLEAAESTNLVLEEEKDSLQEELKRAEVQNQIYERTISDMTEEHHVLILETQVATQDLESGRNSLQKDLQTAEANNNEQLEAIAALTQTMNQKLLELEGARLDLDQKTATIEEQNIMFEDIRREKEAEENNKLPLEQEDTSLLQATEILQQPEISNRPRGKKWYQKMNPFHKHQRKTKG